MTNGTSSPRRQPAPRATYTLPDVAQALGLSRTTVRRRIGDGTIKGFRLGGRQWLITAAELDRIGSINL